MVSRENYGMTLIGNDVLVCGGVSNTHLLSSCALYIASINAWAADATIQPLPVAMDEFPMITLNTRPYVFGGDAGNYVSVNTVYTFDTFNEWDTRTPMQQAVRSHTAVALDTNTALVCGGSHGNAGPALSACFSYAATEDVWSPAAQMITARFGHGTAVYRVTCDSSSSPLPSESCSFLPAPSVAPLRQSISTVVSAPPASQRGECKNGGLFVGRSNRARQFRTHPSGRRTERAGLVLNLRSFLRSKNQ
ncbi:unnamed protein product [Sphagnum balticum]